VVDADCAAGVVGYAIVESGFRLDDASETAGGCQAFLRDGVVVRMKPSGAPGVPGVVGPFTSSTAPVGESCRYPAATRSVRSPSAHQLLVSRREVPSRRTW